MVPLEAREEPANHGNEGYEGKESRLICSAWQIAELWKPCQELSDLEGRRPHIPGGDHIPWRCRGQISKKLSGLASNCLVFAVSTKL